MPSATAIGALLDGARASRGAALVLRGRAGRGQDARCWTMRAERADDLRVLADPGRGVRVRARPTPGCRGCCARHSTRLDALPPPQAAGRWGAPRARRGPPPSVVPRLRRLPRAAGRAGRAAAGAVPGRRRPVARRRVGGCAASSWPAGWGRRGSCCCSGQREGEGRDFAGGGRARAGASAAWTARRPRGRATPRRARRRPPDVVRERLVERTRGNALALRGAAEGA